MNVKALDNDGVVSIFVEAYLQEVGISDEADPSIRNRNVTAILLALFGWSVGDHPGCGFTGCSDVDELYCSECCRHVGLWNYSRQLQSISDVGVRRVVDS